MGRFFGALAFFLLAAILTYLLNMQTIEAYAQTYLSYDAFEAPHVIATFELLHHPLGSFWVIPSWLIAGFLGGIVTRSWKGALLITIITGFILSLTWIFLMSRYLPNYWTYFLSTHNTLEFIGATLGLGLLLGTMSAGPAFLGGYLNSATSHKKTAPVPIKEIQTICPTCGTTFQSAPKFCYKCNTPLTNSE